MKLKEIGNTGHFISAIGQGCMGIGGEFKKDTTLDKEFLWALEYGIDLGMTFIDTAEVYAGGHSETLVGKAAKNKRNELFIATKFSPENNSYDNVLSSAENSLRRLQTSFIDLYQVHWPNPSIPVAETMEALKKLLDQGKIRFIGLSNFSKREMEEAQSFLGETKIVSNQVEYNLFDRFIEQSIMPHCTDQNASIIAYSPLDQGHGFNSEDRSILMNSLSEKYQKTQAQISLNWLLTNPNVFVIPKAAKKHHIEQNASASDFEIEGSDIDLIKQVFSAEPVMLDPKRIKVSLEGKGNRKVYSSIEEAITNDLNMQPSPSELAEFIQQGEPTKPVRVVPSINGGSDYDYELIEGRLRYWAWMIAFNGDRDVPCYVRK